MYVLQVQIRSITGVPAAAPARKDDVLHRGVRFAICKTNKAPTLEQPGNRPEVCM